MTLLRILSLTALLPLLASSLLRAAEPSPEAVPPAEAVTAPATSVIPADWAAALIKATPRSSAFGKVEAGPSSGSVKLVTTVQPEHWYDLQTIVLNELPVKKGETLFIRFAARSLLPDVTTGVTKIRVGFSKATPEWDASYNGELGLGAAWQRFDIPFTCKNDFAPGEARLVFTFGYPAQIAEIADVQLLRYGPEVDLASLPKTRRFADPVTPERIKTELGRIGSLRAQLASADPSPAPGRTLHVATTGSPSADGSVDHPFASIPQALKVVQPGDTILVAAGEYRDPKGISVRTSGRPDAWIKIKAAPGARPKLISSNWSGVEMRGGIAYVEIDGFELEWVADPSVKSTEGNAIHGSGIAMMYATHHIRALNNVVHGFGTGGIISLDCDYLHIEGNTIYNTSKTSPYGGSAISLCRAFDFDKDPGYHNVIRGNICHDNELLVSVLTTSGGNGKALTDGNGIIIDVFNRSRANPLKPHQLDRDGPLAPYHGRTLVENNLVYNNGGRGIHIFRSSNVDVLNNTTYMNQKSRDIQAGEFTAIEGSNIVFANNIAFGRKDKRGNTQDGSSNVMWYRNLFFNTADVLVHQDIIEADPLFTSPGLDATPEGFRLRPGSPALGAGALTNEVVSGVRPPVSDITGKPRPLAGPFDLGAFQNP